jgi:hypothetical protein
MRKSLLTAGLTAFVLAAGSVSATAASQPGWRVTYLSPDSGYDDFGLYDVTATGPQDAWAVGSQTKGAGSDGALLRWNGRRWAEVTVPGSTGSFDHVDGSAPDNVWVTGATGNGARTAWHWDGTSWTSVPTGAFTAADVDVLGPKNAWAVGGADEGADTGTALHWNGTAWRTVAMPIVARRVAAVSAKDIWAVGENAGQPVAAHWDGTAWTSAALPEVPIPAGQNGFAYFNDLVATSSTNVWAVGRLYWGSGEELRDAEHNRPVLMHWDGQAWSLQLGPEGDFALSAGPDGKGGIWYSSFEKTLVHVAKGGTTTTVPVPTPDGRETPGIRQLAGVPGGTTVLAVGEVAPAPGGDQSWDALIEQYH